jgi:hypothetical protein
MIFKGRPYFWKLVGRTPMPCRDIEEWARTFGEDDPHVRLTSIPNGPDISTVFLGCDHAFLGRGPPILFETMGFGGRADETQMRYVTWEEAVRGHGIFVRRFLPSWRDPELEEYPALGVAAEFTQVLEGSGVPANQQSLLRAAAEEMERKLSSVDRADLRRQLEELMRHIESGDTLAGAGA